MENKSFEDDFPDEMAVFEFEFEDISEWTASFYGTFKSQLKLLAQAIIDQYPGNIITHTFFVYIYNIYVYIYDHVTHCNSINIKL